MAGNRWLISLAYLLFLFPVFVITFLIERHEGGILILSYISMFVGYLLLNKFHGLESKGLFFLGLIARLVLCFSLPVLSDDFYRFIWDGRLLVNGFNPFENLPAEYLSQGINGIDQGLYDNLNSPEYFTIYPPVNQLVFWLAALISGDNLFMAVTVIRIPILLADLGAYFLISKYTKRMSLPANSAYLYFLNPLVILELTGNLHFEGVMMVFVLLGIIYVSEQKYVHTARAFALAICSKLLPLMYLPSLLVYTNWKKALMCYVITGVLVIIMFLPLISIDFIEGLSSSIGLYFQKFEFNASVYFVVREIGFWITGYNQIAWIGPVLGITTFLGVLAICLRAKIRNWSFPITILAIHTFYLLMATTVHPWYVISLVCLSCLTQSRFAILWSFLIFLTYLGYTSDGFSLSPIVIWVEYLVVFSLIILELVNPLSNLKKLFENATV